jgi:ornithine cyclodeaminase
MDAMDAALRDVAAGKAALPLRTVIRLADSPNAFATMPAVLGAGAGASLGAKIITVFPGNEATPFDAHIGVVLLFDAEHGTLLAIADASSITAIRTAAVSGVATRALARPDAGDLALLGAGVLALPHIEAIRLVRPVRRIRVWNRSRERAHALAARAKQVRGLDVTICATAREAVESADIICTITSSRSPVLEGAWIAPGAHVNAVGASLPTARELDTAAVSMARLFVDRAESARSEAGDFLLPRADGSIGDDHIVGELGEVLIGRIAGRKSSGDITLFKSLGLAVEDVAALRFIYERARETGAGTNVSLGGLRQS